MINKIRELYPQANITPIDYDPSATPVNQENRIKLMISVGKERLEEKIAAQPPRCRSRWPAWKAKSRAFPAFSETPPTKQQERKPQMSDFVIFDMEWNMGYQPEPSSIRAWSRPCGVRSSRSAR